MVALVVLIGGASAARAVIALACPPGATQTALQMAQPGIYALPVRPASLGTVEEQAFEGRRSQRGCARELRSTESLLSVFQTLAQQLEAEGYMPLLRCGAEDCGGFDFRQALELLPASGHVF